MAKAVEIFKFGPTTDGNALMKAELGGKGANLAEMANLGVPVPPGFTIPCAVSVAYSNQKLAMQALWDEVHGGLDYLTQVAGVEGPDGADWLPLVSVRSGARVSMPGMMDTILNVGITDETLPFWKSKLGDKVALDSYRRLIQMYSSVALGVDMHHFDHALEDAKAKAGITEDKDLTEAQLADLVDVYLQLVHDENKTFPQTVDAQIYGAIEAVFKSWNNPRAIEYRKINGIPEDWGTAVTIQSMVFGNWNDNSATGVLFSRDPSTGATKITGEFLVNAQGEDVVAGIRTPEPLDDMYKWNPVVRDQLYDVVNKLESHYKDMQDIEFTVQDGKLYLLQTRSGKRSAKAAFKIAYDMAKEGLIDKEEAFKRVNAKQLFSLMQDTIDPSFNVPPMLTGIAAGGGLVTGVAVFTSADAVNCTEPCILIRKETDPDDIAGMHKSLGILTATGGLTSHAAVVARGMNKSCVVGCTDLTVNEESGMASAGAWQIKKGEKLTLDGGTGHVWFNLDVPVIPGGADAEVRELLSWGSPDTYTRVTLTPQMPPEEFHHEVKSSNGLIYLDTALMFRSHFSTPDLTNDLAYKLTALIAPLAGLSVQDLVIDLHEVSESYCSSDSVVEFMFGGYGKISLYDAVAKVATSVPPPLISLTTLKLPSDAPTALRNELAVKGFKVAGTTAVSTFADLLNASGDVEITPEVLKMVFGTKAAWEKAKGMVEKTTGKKFSSKKIEPKYWYDMSSTSTGD